MRAIYLVLLLSVFGSTLFSQNTLFINEFMSSNGITIADEDGDFEDWIELYNAGDEAIDLEGYFLSDKIDQPERWEFPSVTLGSEGFLLVFASGKDRYGAELHTNFKISSQGEPLLLTSPDGELVDFLPPVPVARDQSYGRYPDGGENRYLFDLPSPGAPNTKPFGSTVFLDRASGFYESAFDLEIWSDQPGVSIYYTLDGNLPDTNSLVYTEPLEIQPSDELDNNPIISIPTNVPTNSYWYQWKQPGENLFRGQVVRARAFLNGQPYSETVTGTYFVDPHYKDRFDLPVISIVSPEKGLFDYESGIFVPGKGFEEEPLFGGAWSGGNFHHRGREWERNTELYFFEPGGEPGFHQQVGIRTHGGGSRSFPQKSIRLYARKSYGKSHFDYPIFGESHGEIYKRLILRNSGQDFVYSMLADALTHVLVEDWGMEHQSYRPVVLFINGAYWGLINLRERWDKHQFYLLKEVDEEDLDYLEFGGNEVIEGTSEAYKAMIDYLRENSLEEKQHYEYVVGQIDQQNFIDHYIAKMYFGVYDWPGNNIRFWRDRSVDGKWRWVFFDNDDAFSELYFNSYDHLQDTTNTGWPNPPWSTELYRNLMLNEDFREAFFRRVEEHLNHSFRPDNSVPLAVSVAERISGEIPHHIERWRYPETHSQWTQNIGTIIQFLEDRPCVFWEMTLEYFGKDPGDYPLEYCDPSHTDEILDPDSGILLYPNPTSGKVNVLLDEPHLIRSIKLFDTKGREVFSPNFIRNLPLERMQIRLPELPAGIYTLLIETQDGIRTDRLVIMR